MDHHASKTQRHAAFTLGRSEMMGSIQRGFERRAINEQPWYCVGIGVLATDRVSS